MYLFFSRKNYNFVSKIYEPNNLLIHHTLILSMLEAFSN